MPPQELSCKDWTIDLLPRGVPCAMSQRLTAPVEPVQLVIQNPGLQADIKIGQVSRCAPNDIGNYLSRIYVGQDVAAFWRGNFTNCAGISNASFPPVCQGFCHEEFPKVQPEARFRHVIRSEHGIWWFGRSAQSDERMSSRLCSNALYFGCWL